MRGTGVVINVAFARTENSLRLTCTPSVVRPDAGGPGRCDRARTRMAHRTGGPDMHMDERRNAACRVDSSDTELASSEPG